jgi:hypothetical protein
MNLGIRKQDRHVRSYTYSVTYIGQSVTAEISRLTRNHEGFRAKRGKGDFRRGTPHHGTQTHTRGRARFRGSPLTLKSARSLFLAFLRTASPVRRQPSTDRAPERVQVSRLLHTQCGSQGAGSVSPSIDSLHERARVRNQRSRGRDEANGHDFSQSGERRVR